MKPKEKGHCGTSIIITKRRTALKNRPRVGPRRLEALILHMSICNDKTFDRSGNIPSFIFLQIIQFFSHSFYPGSPVVPDEILLRFGHLGQQGARALLFFFCSFPVGFRDDMRVHGGDEETGIPVPQRLFFCGNFTIESKPLYLGTLEDSSSFVRIEEFGVHKWNSCLVLLLPDKCHWMCLVPAFRTSTLWSSRGCYSLQYEYGHKAPS